MRKKRTIEIDPASVRVFKNLPLNGKKAALVSAGVMTEKEWIQSVRTCRGCGGLFVIIAEQEEVPRLDNPVLTKAQSVRVIA